MKTEIYTLVAPLDEGCKVAEGSDIICLSFFTIAGGYVSGKLCIDSTTYTFSGDNDEYIAAKLFKQAGIKYKGMHEYADFRESIKETFAAYYEKLGEDEQAIFYTTIINH
jgi:hypothetical protein